MKTDVWFVKTDVWFVQPCVPSGDSRTEHPYNPLCEVWLPQDLSRFVLIDDADGFDVMFKYRGRWRELAGVCWRDPGKSIYGMLDRRPCSLTGFGRKVLRKAGVKEMTWRQWQKERKYGTSGTT